MEPRIVKTYEVNRERVNATIKKVGTFYDGPPTDEEKRYMEKKGLTLFQLKLLKLFKIMFDQELIRSRQEQDLLGWSDPKERVTYSGLTFSQKMDQNERIAEHIFKEWASNLGIDTLYDNSRKADENDVENCSHAIDICYDTFSPELVEVKNRSRYMVVEPEYKTGNLVSVTIEGIRNSSGKCLYKRFVSVLKMLK